MSETTAATRIARNTIILGLGDGATKLAIFVLYAVIARTLGQSGFGDYTLAVSLAFFIRVAALGTDVIVSREVARHVDRVHGLFWQSITLKLAVGTPVLIGTVAFAVLTGEPGAVVLAVGLIGLSNLIDLVAFSLQAVLRGREVMGPPARGLALESLLIAVLGSVLLLAFDGGIAGLGVVYVIAALAALGYIAGAMLRRGIRPRLRGESSDLRHLARASVPTGIANFFSLALGRLDAVILAVMTNSATVGLYGGAYRIFEATLVVNWSFGLAIFPVLSRLQRGSQALRNAFELSCKAVSLVTAPLTGALIFFGGPILRLLLGESFDDAATALAILAGATFLYGLFVVAALTVAGQDRQGTFPLIAGVALAVNVAINIALIPSLGVEGAAIAMTVAQGLATALLVREAMRQTHGVTWPRMFASPLAGFAALAAVAAVLGDGWGSLVVALVAYVAVALGTERLLCPADSALVIAVLRRRGAAGPSRRHRRTAAAAPRRGLSPRLGGALFAVAVGVLAGLLSVLGAVTTPLIPLGALAALAIGALALTRPVDLGYAAVLLIPLETVSAKAGSFGLTPTEVLILAAAGGWLLRRLVVGGGPIRSPMTWPLVAILAAHVPALFFAVDRFAVVKELLMWSACFVVFLAVISDRRPRATETTLRVLAAAGAIVAFLAVAKSAGTQQVAIDFGGSVSDRATGSFQSPVLLAIFVAMTLPLQLVFAFRGRTSVIRWSGRIGALAVVAAMALALTRSAFVGLTIALVWLFFAWRPARRLALAVAVVLGLLFVTGINPAPSVFNTSVITERISSIASPQTHTVQLRYQLWRAAPKMLADNLPFGVGAKNFPKHAAQYGLVFAAGPPSNAHNTLLVVATEFGLCGLLALAWIVVALARTLAGAIRNHTEPQHSLALALTASFLAIAVDGITDYGYGDNAFFLAFILLIAGATRLHREAATVAAEEEEKRAAAPAEPYPWRPTGSPAPRAALPAGVA